MKRRLKLLKIGQAMIGEFLSAGKHSAYVGVTNCVPYDAMVVSVNYSYPTIDIVLMSDEFPEVQEGEIVPELRPQFSRIS